MCIYVCVCECVVSSTRVYLSGELANGEGTTFQGSPAFFSTPVLSSLSVQQHVCLFPLSPLELASLALSFPVASSPSSLLCSLLLFLLLLLRLLSTLLLRFLPNGEPFTWRSMARPSKPRYALSRKVRSRYHLLEFSHLLATSPWALQPPSSQC